MIPARSESGTPRIAPGFTLVELLVVIAIIAILGGLSLAGLQVAQRSGNVGAEKHTVSMLKVGIGSFAQEHGDYPPTSLAFYGLKVPNKINEGNESLFASLQARKGNGPFIDEQDLDERRWQNYDADKLSTAALKKLKKVLDWTRSGDKLLEYTDFWDNPYVYIHNRDYGKKFTYRDAEGRTFQVQAAKSGKTGGYAASTSYQLWSLGPDGINQNGGGDDICSWKS